MKTVSQPRVFLIGQSKPNLDEVRDWLDFIGAKNFNVPEGSTPGEQLVQLCGKRCYMSFEPGLNPNVQRVRTDMADFIGNILKVGHGSVIAHATYNFALEGVTRVFTAEMNRHRIGWQADEADDVELAISEGSMRFIRYDDINYLVPPSIRMDVTDGPGNVNHKRSASQKVFMRAFTQAEENYAELMDIWKDELAPESSFTGKKHVTSMMRRIIPIGVCTGGVWSGGLRALRNVFLMRCAPEAEEEILWVANMMLEKMIDTEPNFFKDFEKDDQGFYRPRYHKV